jgi:hypothetical protein
MGRMELMPGDKGVSGTQGYLDRMGFFGLLHSHIKVVPNRPSCGPQKPYAGDMHHVVI